MQVIASSVSLADWRRRVAELYAAVRRADDPKAAWHLWRRTRDQLIRTHPQSPFGPEQRVSFSGLPYFDYDPRARLTVDLDPVSVQDAGAWDLGEDGTIRLRRMARTRGLAAAFGAELSIFWIAGYGGGIFLPFTDATSGRETYTAGRYLLDGIKGADLGMAGERLVLDFNFSYNPSCAYSPRWNCPLAPAENRLPAGVHAGERWLAPTI
jgi:hypothetical protein